MPQQNVNIPEPRATKNGGLMVFFREYPTRDEHRAVAKSFGCKSKDCPVQPSNKGNGFMVFKPLPTKTVTVAITDDDE